MSDKLHKILTAQYKKIITKLDNEYYTCVIDSDNIQKWYILIKNLDIPYKDGEYYFEMYIPDDFPDKPPNVVKALTPNGVFKVGDNICVSIGTFHTNDYDSSGSYGWRAALGIGGFILNGVVNAIMNFDDYEQGLGIQIASVDKKKQLALESKEYNDTNLDNLVFLFNEHKVENSGLKVWG